MGKFQKFLQILNLALVKLIDEFYFFLSWFEFEKKTIYGYC